MTDAARVPNPPLGKGGENPAARLEAAFRHIAETRMAGMAMVNPALAVEAVGFQSWNGDWLGVLVTPWFMSLVCLPGPDAVWEETSSGTKREMELPSGTYEFLTAHEDTLGPYLTSSLFSPMFEFADMGQAREVATAVLAEVFTPLAPEAPAPGLTGTLERPVSRRGFLGAFVGLSRP